MTPLLRRSAAVMISRTCAVLMFNWLAIARSIWLSERTMSVKSQYIEASSLAAMAALTAGHMPRAFNSSAKRSFVVSIGGNACRASSASKAACVGGAKPSGQRKPS